MKPLAITLGDPAGIGPEVVHKALQELDVPYRLFGDVPAGVRYGEISAEYGQIALRAIHQAIDAVESGLCSALVTAPIHKQSIALAGSPYPGHTELLAARAGLTRYGEQYAMYFASPRLRVVLLSVHVPLREAIATIEAGKDRFIGWPDRSGVPAAAWRCAAHCGRRRQPSRRRGRTLRRR